MKYLTLIITILFSLNLVAQNYKQLVTYGQVWGFLKYHNEYPSKVDWDNRLMNDFDRLKNCSDQEFNSIINDLLIDCAIQSTEKIELSNYEVMNGVMDWLSIAQLNDKQKKKIEDFRIYKKDFTNNYVKITKVGTASFQNEKSYLEDEITRPLLYLSITRYWNAVNYFFPYRELIPEDWSATYLELLPDVLECENEMEYMYAIKKLSAKLQEGHGFVSVRKKVAFRYPEHTKKIFPFHLIDLEDGTFITSVPTREGERFNLKRGDRVVKINNQKTEERWTDVGQFVSASNEYARRKYSWFFRQTNKDSVLIEVQRGEETIKLKIPTYTYDEVTEIYNRNRELNTDPPLPAYEQRVDSISGIPYLYIDLAILTRQDIDFKFKHRLRKNDHVVIDVRNYPNWTILKLCKVLLKGKQHFALGGRMTTMKPGAIKYTPTQKVGGWREYMGNVYILVDRVTQSQAEYTVMGLQLHPRSTTIGGQTAGADGNVTILSLPFGLKAKFSGIGIVYPDGGQTQQTGIRRDIEIRQNSSYLTYPKNDRILNEALRLIRTKSFDQNN